MALAIAAGVDAQPREPIVGLPCEGCEAVFEGRPASLTSMARLTAVAEPGTPMTLTGRVVGPDGQPRGGVIVYAYQTNAKGIYPPPPRSVGRDADRHGALRGFVVSSADGRYRFDTIRPGPYPTRDLPEHIHMHVVEPGCATYYIDDVLFTDDPLLTTAFRGQQTGRGGSGIVTPRKQGDAWQVSRDIQLGRNIPGYRPCERQPGGPARP